MGNQSSLIDPVHLRMYSNIIQIQDPHKRSQVIQTCLASIEYVNSAKRSSIYSYLLQYLSIVQSGAEPDSSGEHCAGAGIEWCRCGGLVAAVTSSIGECRAGQQDAPIAVTLVGR